MASMRDIKRRIRSVKSTQQITRAMKMVAAAKLRKAQTAVIAARPYSDNLDTIIKRLVGCLSSFTHPLLVENPEGKVAYVVVSADKGLCGGYNQNLLRLARQELDRTEAKTSLTVVGRKGREYFLRRDYQVDEEYLDFGDLPDFTQARELARELMEVYIQQKLKQMFLVYTKFESVINHQPVVVPLLPIIPAACETRDEKEYIYEPGEHEVMSNLLPRFVEVTMYRVILESKASEHGARMTAMDSATENAEDMIARLTLSYNRARQAAITTEISEIVGGADALN